MQHTRLRLVTRHIPSSPSASALVNCPSLTHYSYDWKCLCTATRQRTAWVVLPYFSVIKIEHFCTYNSVYTLVSLFHNNGSYKISMQCNISEHKSIERDWRYLSTVTLQMTPVFAHAAGYLDAIGSALITACGCIPSGVLCFFPSWSLLNACRDRWLLTGKYTPRMFFICVLFWVNWLHRRQPMTAM